MTAFMPLAIEKDLRWDFMATGRGSLSIRCTGVQETMDRQHRSWRLKTGTKKGNMDVTTGCPVRYSLKFNCRHETSTMHLFSVFIHCTIWNNEAGNSLTPDFGNDVVVPPCELCYTCCTNVFATFSYHFVSKKKPNK